MASVRITGLGDLRRALKRAGPLATAALAAAALKEQEQVITKAKARTPVDLGTLKGSGTVLPLKVSGTRVEVVSGFGGAASGYAIPVHEGSMPHWIHADTSGFLWWPGAAHPVESVFHPGAAPNKFLESAFLEQVPSMPRGMAKTVEAALRQLGS